nr:MAG TPA: hypothetical protein [Caudoviricetes sp.]
MKWNRVGRPLVVSGDASVVLKIYTASNHDNARAATPLVAAAQVERRSSQAR